VLTLPLQAIEQLLPEQMWVYGDYMRFTAEGGGEGFQDGTLPIFLVGVSAL
jgi:hypothetical protein